MYRPAHACKVYLPKASGGLRPYSLLTVEDQIVYQAHVNVIAERFHPRIREWYFGEVYSHVYAGPTSVFFYKRWADGFAAFNRGQREAFADGRRFTARFDLTACFDSLDHNVLRHFLDDLGCDPDFCRRFCALLSHWTATGLDAKRPIYQGHGIPQGPLSSGLLAEVVLHHFDRRHRRRPGVRYLRYVDDIRLYARTEKDVRAAVYDLDLLSKEVGLFPQSAKIEIHEVGDIEDELKGVSRPEDGGIDWEAVGADQKRVHALLAELSPRFRLTDATRFKFLLGKAAPRAATNRRLWRLLERYPDLSDRILSYFRRYERLPKRDAVRLVEELRTEDTHGTKIADLVRTAEGRLPPPQADAVDEVVEKHWRQRARLPADLVAALGHWSLRRNLLTPGRVEVVVAHAPAWYARAALVAALDSRAVAQPRLNDVLFARLSDPASDVAVAAAVQLGLQGTVVPAGAPMHVAAGPVLAAFGVLDGAARRACGIAHAFERLLGYPPPAVDWAAFFGRAYRRAEVQAVRWSGYLADATAWVNAMDVFDDRVLDALYRRDRTVRGVYKLGSIGSVLGLGSPLAAAYPAVFALARDVHDRRLSSDLSHPRKRRGSTYLGPTSHVPFGYLRTARKLTRVALAELHAKWPLATVAPRTAIGR